MVEIITSSMLLQVGKTYEGIHKQTGQPVRMAIIAEATEEDYLDSDVEVKNPLGYYYKVSFD